MDRKRRSQLRRVGRTYPFATPEGSAGVYGTAFEGGAHAAGTVYDASNLTFGGAIYNFCSAAGCVDGSGPSGSVIDNGGFLYGTTEGGGSAGEGTVYKLDLSSGVETVLHSFDFAVGADGALPYSGLTTNAAETLFYGTTNGGGAGDEGTVFELNVSSGALTILHSFSGSPSGDGASPVGGVILDSAGNLYGTTSQGGKFGKGAVYEISAAGKETVLYSFTGGADGSGPQGGLALDAAGNLIGTTTSGGLGYGTLFELTPGGTLGVIHTFCSLAGCADGATPTGPLYAPSGAVFFGTAVGGGASGKGVVFELSE